MQIEETRTERRQTPRIKIRNGVFAVMMFAPYSIKLGKIDDISRNGLAFHYESWEEWPQNNDRLDLLYGEKGCYIERLPIKTVSDVALNDLTPFMTTRTRRRGVKFTEMTDEQLLQLDGFLAYMAADNAASS